MVVAGTDYDIQLEDYGFQIEPGAITRSDVTAALPRVAVGTESKQRSDFSELDTLGQFSFHHGRGQLAFLDATAYMDTDYLDTRIQGQAIPAPLRRKMNRTGGLAFPPGEAVDMVYWDRTGLLYLLWRGTAVADNHLYSFNTTTSEWDVVTGADATLGVANSYPTRIQIMSMSASTRATSSTTDFMVISRNKESANTATTNLTYIYSSNGTTFAASVSANSAAVQFTIFKERLVFDSSNSSVILRPDPTVTTNEIIVSTVGSNLDPINNICLLGEVLVVLKSTGAYGISLDAAGTAYICKPILDYSWAKHVDNGKAAVVWNGSLYFNIGTSVYQFSGTTMRPVGPDLGATEIGTLEAREGVVGLRQSDYTYRGLPEDKRGPFIGFTSSGNWIWGTMKSASNDGLIFAYGGQGWHQVSQTVVGEAGGKLWYFSPLTTTGTLSRPILFYRSGTGYLSTLYLSPNTEDRYDYTSVDYETANVPRLTTSWFDAGLPEVPKDLLELHLLLDLPRGATTADPPNSGGSAVGITVEYEVDYSGTWVAVAGTQFGVTPIYFPDNILNSSGLRAKAIRFRFSWINNAGQAPRMRGYFIRFISRPPSRYGWRISLRAEANTERPNNLLDTRSAKEILQRLTQLRASYGPIRFDDGQVQSGGTNHLVNPGFDGWSAGVPIGWSAYNGGVLAQSSAIKYQSGMAVLLSGNATASVGIVSQATASIAAGSLYAVVRGWASAGSWTVELLKDGVVVASSTSLVAVTPTTSHQLLGINRFTRISIPYTATTAGTYTLRIRTTANSAAARLYVDACELREGIDDNSDFIGPGEPRCRETTTGTYYATTYFRPPFHLVYITTISSVQAYPQALLDANGVRTTVYGSRVSLELREAF